MKHIPFWIIFSIYTLNVSAQTNGVVTLQQTGDWLLVGKNLFYLEDASGKLSIKDIQAPVWQKKWIRHTKDVFSQPATHAAIWFKVQVCNLTTEDAWLEIGSTLPWYIDFYVPNHQGVYQLPLQTGTMRPVKNKSYQVNTFWLPLNKAKDIQIKTYYIRIKCGFTFEAPMHIGTLRSFHQNKSLNDFLVGGFVGIMLIMFLYNLFVYFSTRDHLYLFYLGYLLWTSFTIPHLNNYPFLHYLTPSLVSKEWWQSNFYLWHPPIYVFVGYFCIVYLHLSQKLPWVKRLLQLEMIILVLVYPLLYIFGMSNIDITTPYQLIVLLFYFTCLFSGYYLFFKRDYHSMFYALGWTFMIVGVFIYLSAINGALPFNNFTRNIMYFGFSIEAWMFSLALGNKINVMRQQTQTAQRQVLEKMRENQKLIKEQNDVLEKTVKERTRELEESKDKILAQKESIRSMNKSLEDKVKKRTQILSYQNEKFKEYTFANSHKVRKPLANVLGLINLIDEEDVPPIIHDYMKMLAQNAHELDDVIREMNTILDGVNFFTGLE
jgi:two-component system, sensor histidine kinase LadS